jgi:hypothetical protein
VLLPELSVLSSKIVLMAEGTLLQNGHNSSD